jgi:hypothetical protein
MGAKPDLLGQIEDPTVRRFVRVVVHVRRFLPFYVGGVLFALTMAIVPTIDGGERGTLPSAAGMGGGAGSAARPAGSTGATGATATARRAVATVSSGAASGELAAATFLDDDVDGAAGVDGATPGGGASTATADRRTAPADPLAGSPDVAAPNAPDDLDDAPDVPEACRLEPPSPAPAVDPTRELSGGQNTAEALAGQQLPVDSGETVKPVSEATICNVPDAPVEAPSVPLPATPVSADGGGGLAGLPFLGFVLRLLALG